MPKAIHVNNTDLARDKRFTYLTEDVISTGTTIRVQSILGFEGMSTSSGQIICIGEMGEERTELLRSSVTSGYNPSQAYKEVTLRDSMNFNHPQDTKVYIIDWNRVSFEWSSTLTGTKSTLRAYPLDLWPDLSETHFVDTSQTTGYYFTRFNENVGSTYSDYSDAIPYAGYDDNTVFSIKKRALSELGEEIDGKIITHEFLNEKLWEARREYHLAPGKRPFRRKFNVDIGNALTGSFRIELPTDVEKPFTSENIYGVRIGTEKNMEYIDKKEWDEWYRNVPHTFLTTAYAVGDQDLYVSNARDFSGSGAITVEGTSVSYSAKSNTGGTMRISTAGSWAASVGSDVWQNASYGLPDKFTVFADPDGSAYIYFNRPIDTAYIGQNIYSDFYSSVLGRDSDADKLDEPNYDIFIHYLKAKIKDRKIKGEKDISQDSDYKLWIFKKNTALASEVLDSNIRIFPDISHLSIPE